MSEQSGGGAQAAPDPETLVIPQVGDAVLIQGTGRWWAGSKFRAVVADVRESDGTVKVRYNDGGYKRFPQKEFLQLVAADDDHWESDFGMEPCQWADDAASPSEDAAARGAYECAAQALHGRAHDAGLAGDAQGAEEAARRLAELRRTYERLKLERAALSLAIKQTDFLRAHDVKQRLVELESQFRQVSQPPLGELLRRSARRAVGGGLAGAGAMVVQVFAFMWLRTTMYYQHRYGTSTRAAVRALYSQGGVRRFYKGIVPTLAQGPLCRFGDTAANAGVLTLCDGTPYTADLPVSVKMLFCSAAAALWRVLLMPLDTVKCFMQVEGADGLRKLRAKRKAHGPLVYWHGAVAMSAATFTGHYPWFATHQLLDARLPVPDGAVRRLARDAGVGFCASIVSDCSSNSLRVLKTYRQTSDSTYSQAAQSILKSDGIAGLLGRGLGTRVAANGLQGMVFSVVWNALDQRIQRLMTPPAADLPVTTPS